MIAYIIAALVLIFLLFGYLPIIKRYLPKRCRFAARSKNNTVNFYSKPGTLITAFIPFIKMKSVISAETVVGGVPIKITAKKGKKVVCTNAAALGKNGFTINGSVPRNDIEINLEVTRIEKRGQSVVKFFRAGREANDRIRPRPSEAMPEQKAEQAPTQTPEQAPMQEQEDK